VFELYSGSNDYGSWSFGLDPRTGVSLEWEWNYDSHSGGFITDEQESTWSSRGEAAETLGVQQQWIALGGAIAIPGNPVSLWQFRAGRAAETLGKLAQAVTTADHIIDVTFGDKNTVNIQTGASATSPNHARISASVDVPDLVRSASAEVLSYAKKRYIEYLQTPGPVYF